PRPVSRRRPPRTGLPASDGGGVDAEERCGGFVGETQAHPNLAETGGRRRGRGPRAVPEEERDPGDRPGRWRRLMPLPVDDRLGAHADFVGTVLLAEASPETRTTHMFAPGLGLSREGRILGFPVT